MSIFQAAMSGQRNAPEPQREEIVEAPKKSIFQVAKESAIPSAKVNSKRETTENSGFKEHAMDIGQQVVKEGLIGGGGAYGDILDLFGLQAKDQLPGQVARNTADFDVLERMQQPGYKPSFSDIYSLSDDDVAPNISRLPGQQDLREFNDMIGGPGDAQTTSGRYAGRAANIYGGGVALGVGKVIPAVAAGIAGEGTKDLGGGPLLQAGAEIAALLLTQGRSGSSLSSSKKAVQDEITKLRNLGYTDQDITLAINAGKKGQKTAQNASRGKATDQAFEQAAKSSEKAISETLNKAAPDLQQGTAAIHEAANATYGKVLEEASKIVIDNPKPFLDASKKVVDHLQKTLGKNSQATEFIKEISEAAMNATNFPTAENAIIFYKRLNEIGGNWVTRKEKHGLLGIVKNGIKEMIGAHGEKGQKLLANFEKANTEVQRAFRVEKGNNILQKAISDEGWNWNTLKKIFDDPKKVENLELAFGPKATENLSQIAKISKSIHNFDKAWKGVSGNISASDVASYGGALYYLFKKEFLNAAAFMAFKGAKKGVTWLREQSLTSPKFQSLEIRALHALKDGSAQSFERAAKGMQDYLEEEGVSIEK